MLPNDDLAEENGRTIGNGVVLAYIAFAASATALAALGHLDAVLALGAIGGAFIVVFTGDMTVQRADMRGGVPVDRHRDDADAATDTEPVAE